MSKALPYVPGNVLQQPLMQAVQLIHVAEQLSDNFICERLVMAGLLPHFWQQRLQAHSIQQSTNAQTDTQTNI